MRLWWGVAALAAAGLGVAGAYWLPGLIRGVEAPIVIGLVHSRSGPLDVAASGMLDAEVLALEEINAAGGLLGRRVTWKIIDGRSDPAEFGRAARRLIEEDKAVMIVGGLTSACRAAMTDVTIPAGVLLIHAGLFEGMEDVKGWFGVGPLPNQQAMPAVSWCVDSLKARKFFLAGSRDVSSYAVHAVVRDQLKALGLETVGEGFVGIDGSGVDELVAALKESGADVVVSSIAGDANAGFFKRAAAAGLTPEKTPIVSLRIFEGDLPRLPSEETAGHYVAAGYLQSLGGEANRRFVERFKARFGGDRTIGDPTASVYYGVKLWARAVEEAESTDLSELLEHLSRQSLNAGEGIIAVDYELISAWRPFRVGKIRRDGQIDEVWALDRSIRPVAYPIFRSVSAWRSLLAEWRSTAGPGIGDAGSARPPSSAAAPSSPPPPMAWRSPAAPRQAASTRPEAR